MTTPGRKQTLGLRARPPTMVHHWRPGFGFTPPRSEIIREDSFFSKIPPFPTPCTAIRIPPIMRHSARLQALHALLAMFNEVLELASLRGRLPRLRVCQATP